MSEIEECWVIQRDDGKFYAGWNFDRNWEAKECFTNVLEKVIINKQVFTIKDALKEIRLMNLQNCRPVKVKIEMVGEDDE